MKYDFDTVIDRRGSNCTKWDMKEFYLETGFADRFDEDTISAFTADMDFRCAEPILDAIRKVADHGVLGYTSVRPCDAYFKAVTDWYARRYDWQIQKDWIVYTRGTIPALTKAVETFTDKNAGVIIMRPVYLPFAYIVETTGRVVKNCELQNDGKGYYTIDFEKLEQLAAEPDTQALILCNPHNPVGRVWSREELTRVKQICAEHQVLVLADEVHGDLTRIGINYQPTAADDPADKNVITFTGVNKTFNLAGLSVSNVIIPDEEKRNRYLEKRGNEEPSPFDIAALVAAYTQCDDWVEQLREYIDGNIDWILNFLKERIPEVVCWRPEGTYILWMDFRKTGYTPEEIHQKIYVEANVLLESGTLFDPEHGAGFERICVPTSRVLLEEAFERIAKAFGR